MKNKIPNVWNLLLLLLPVLLMLLSLVSNVLSNSQGGGSSLFPWGNIVFDPYGAILPTEPKAASKYIDPSLTPPNEGEPASDDGPGLYVPE